MDKIPIIAVVGPTASGKTALAIELAKAYGGEIVSADSMQIYEGMDIATAKPTPEELAQVPHHLIGVIPPDKDFSVADYVSLAKREIDDITARGKLPILCGGTGLYINSLIDNVKFDETGADKALREKYTKIAEESGNRALWEMLKKVDPASASTLHENNVNRVIRALEVYELSGKRLSESRAESRSIPSPYKPYIVGLTYSDREMLYSRIGERVDQMLEAGLIKEADEIRKSPQLRKTSAQAIGYKELLPYFDGKYDLITAIDKIKQETRRYAKRQLTWFRRDKRVNWIFRDEYESVEKISEKIQKDIAKTDFL